MKHSDVFKLALGPLEKLVLLALLDYGDRAFPRQETLATKASISRSAVQRAVRKLREAGYVTTTSRGKALCYRLCCVPQTQHDASNRRKRCVTQTLEMRPIDAGILTNPFNESIQPGAADAAAGGWEVPDGLEDRIRARDPRADFSAQAKVCRRIMAQHGLTLSEAERAWVTLCHAWARTGINAYELLAKATLGLEHARSPRGLLLHKLREVAA